MRFAFALSGIVVGAVVGGLCGLATQDGTPRCVADGAVLDAHRRLAPPVVEGNLTVWPVTADRVPELGEFITLAQALERGVASVSEVGDSTAADEAQVGRLVVENSASLPMLICAGTLLSGGNQDRQLASDVVVAPHAKQQVDVFCVEPGRWTDVREGEETGAKFGAPEVVATKGVRASGQYRKSQDAVWREVAVVSSIDASAAGLRGAHRTSLLRVIEDASDESMKARADAVAKVRAHFDAVEASGERVVGFAYAVDGRTAGVRTFATPQLLRGHLGAFVASMVIEAEAVRRDGPTKAARAEDVVALVRSVDESRDCLESDGEAHRLRVRESALGFSSACFLATGMIDASPLTEDWTSK